MEVTPSLETVYAMVLDVESNIAKENLISGSALLARPISGTSMSYKGPTNTSGDQKSRYCVHSKRPGHTKEFCFKLMDSLPDWYHLYRKQIAPIVPKPWANFVGDNIVNHVTADSETTIASPQGTGSSINSNHPLVGTTLDTDTAKLVQQEVLRVLGIHGLQQDINHANIA
ncbi:hypothetical protein M569_00173 [Genlisea aurea]|uniref:Uncharacterized protein n=1 Tax=Genlisea aurea TaxID=192259 RepID=S8D4B0_9LAMI|nr:hypothetical protein M569_00173 [Genlisea aurea]